MPFFLIRPLINAKQNLSSVTRIQTENMRLTTKKWLPWLRLFLAFSLPLCHRCLVWQPLWVCYFTCLAFMNEFLDRKWLGHVISIMSIRTFWKKQHQLTTQITGHQFRSHAVCENCTTLLDVFQKKSSRLIYILDLFNCLHTLDLMAAETNVFISTLIYFHIS